MNPSVSAELSMTHRDIEDVKTRIRLIDGQQFDPWDPAKYHSDDYVAPDTVAYHLARLCRYGGAVKRLYGVAEHCVFGAVAILTKTLPNEQRTAVARAVLTAEWDAQPIERLLDRTHHDVALTALQFLVHDAPEGLGLVDMPGPICRRPEMSEYRAAHERCLAWVCSKWSIPLPFSPEVKQVDKAMLGAEYGIRLPRADDDFGAHESLPEWPWLDMRRLRFDWIEVPNHINPRHVDGSQRFALPAEHAWMYLYKRLRRAALRTSSGACVDVPL